MKTLFAAAVVVATVLAAPAPASAQVSGPGPQISDRPAATLLLPYFEVHADTNRENTFFSVTNTSATAILTNVTIWSEFSVPVLIFNVYLTGYDVQTFDMREILDGFLPQTASFGQDTIFAPNFISPKGPLSDDDDFDSCDGVLPPVNLSPAQADAVRRALTGQDSSLFGGLCASRPQVGGPADKIARGYVTIDTVNACTSGITPETLNYNTYLTDQNVLAGEFVLLHPAKDQAQGDNLVHIYADASDPDTSTPGQYTFYGRYNGWTAVDHREPLASILGARFIGGGIYQGGSVIVWRDSKVASQGPVTCGFSPPWVPLGQEQIVAFDEQENPEDLSSLTPFPVETQKVSVSSIGTSFTFGWLYLNLDHNATGGPDPTEDPTRAQAWVLSLFGSVTGPGATPGAGLFSAGMPAVQLESARTPGNNIINAPAVTGGRQ